LDLLTDSQEAQGERFCEPVFQMRSDERGQNEWVLRFAQDDNFVDVRDNQEKQINIET
jgi:hypothetical protein